MIERSAPLWRPSAERIAQAELTKFSGFVAGRFPEIDVSTYEALHQWSITSTTDFWRCIWDYSDVIASHESDEVVCDLDKMPGASWFPDARLNFAENLLRRRGDQTAIISLLENGTRSETSFDELYAQVAAIAAALKARGVEPGDRVAGFMPNVTETVVAMLAATSLGAVWTSCSPDFGFQGVMDRFGQVNPKVLFAANGYYYNGKAHDSLDKVRQIAQEIDSLEHVVIVEIVEQAPDIAGVASHNGSYRGSQDVISNNAGCLRTCSVNRQTSRKSRLNNCLSIIRSTSCTPRARPAYRSALCMAPAAR